MSATTWVRGGHRTGQVIDLLAEPLASDLVLANAAQGPGPAGQAGRREAALQRAAFFPVRLGVFPAAGDAVAVMAQGGIQMRHHSLGQAARRQPRGSSA
jgi:hypothetical protein